MSSRAKNRGNIALPDPGIGLALLAAALFGLSAPFAKLLLRDAAPQLLAGLLYLGSGLGLALVFAYRRLGSASPREAPLTRRDLPWLAGAIAFGGVAGPLLLMLGLTRASASSASLLLNLEGVFTALLAWFVFRENFDKRIALGMCAIVIGGVALSWQRNPTLDNLVGPFAVALACLAWGIDNNLTQKVSAGDPVQVAMLKGLAAGTVNTVIALAIGAHWPDGGRVISALIVGFLGYGVSLVLYVLALRRLGTARTGAYFSAAPFVGAAASLAIFRERPTGFFALGAAFMAVGVWLHVTERHEHAHVHEPLEHEHLHVHDEHHQHEHEAGAPPGEPHSHPHRHEALAHSHAHYPDIHHRHPHD